MTLKQQYETALAKLGYVRVRHGVSKDKWQKPDGTCYVFVGLAGSVRVGKTLAMSRPISKGQKQTLLGIAAKP